MNNIVRIIAAIAQCSIRDNSVNCPLPVHRVPRSASVTGLSPQA
jgi:hypothetical protein